MPSFNRHRDLPSLIQQQDGVCPWCNQRLPDDLARIHADHIVPKSRGGADDISNRQALHAECNLQKAVRSGIPAPFDPATDPFLHRLFRDNFDIFGIAPVPEPVWTGFMNEQFASDVVPDLVHWAAQWQLIGSRFRPTWRAEATKRLLDVSLGENGRIAQSQVWVWETDQVNEILDMQMPAGHEFAPHPGVGIGLHLFTSTKGKEFPVRDENGVFIGALHGYLLLPDDHYAIVTMQWMDGSGTPKSVLRMVNAKPGEADNMPARLTGFLKSRIAISRGHRAVDRQMIKELKRSSRPIDPTQVRTVTFRQPRPDEVEGDHREIGRDKHWWVEGHLRAQWYPSIEKHALIWIYPHVKGDPDAPLHITPRVNVVSR